ncbi:MAG: hypothetical protein E3J23_08585 [Candidatus Stahlbacteria bacterium]|nr:MAG: hypothetical protein E3J23_08585 [Candidatus Stahlbacteria bacterium]
MDIKEDRIFLSDISKKYGWKTRILSQIIFDAGIKEIREARNSEGEKQRYLNKEENKKLEEFIAHPIYKTKNSLNSEYWGTPAFLRIT